MAVLLAGTFLMSCSSTIDSVQQAATGKFQNFIANQFSKRFLQGIDTSIAQLSAAGGFLNDPIVKILLPPPLGLVVGVASELKNNPKATLLDTLINQAAENSVPVAGPILKDIVMNMDTPTLEGLVNGSRTSATDYLKQKAGPAMQQALLPGVTQQLQSSGAVALYGELLDTHAAQQQATSEVAQSMLGTQPTPALVPQPVSKEQLGQYVAEQTMGGVFKKVAQAELSVRESLEVPY